MNDYDKGARFGAKLAPRPHASWLLPGASRTMRFSRWLDSQSAPRPGEPDRRCDTIMELVHREGRSHPRAVVLESFTRPDEDALDRTGEYLWRFRRSLRHGPQRQRDKYPPLVGVMLFLTGRCAEKNAASDLPDEIGVKNSVEPKVVEMQEQNGLVFLEQIAENRLSAYLLFWVVLMLHGQKASTARWWTRLCRERLGAADAREVAGLAWNFCDLTDCRAVWRPYLESFIVEQSTFLREARVETQRDWLSRTLKNKLAGPPLTAALAVVANQSDPAILSSWFDLSLALPPEAILAELLKHP